MSAKDLTYSDVAEHNTKKDLYTVIHDKVYDITKFIDEHPGGEEVLLDIGGQDSTEAFEDVGHSDEARESLDTMLIGNLKRVEGDPEPNSKAPVGSGNNVNKADSTNTGIGIYAIILVGGLAAYFALQYVQSQQGNAQQA